MARPDRETSNRLFEILGEWITYLKQAGRVSICAYTEFIQFIRYLDKQDKLSKLPAPWTAVIIPMPQEPACNRRNWQAVTA
jgi:hypothetical protein